jgi:hypothetical protein
LTQGWRPCSVKIIVAKSKEVKTGCNLAEFKEGYGSRRAVLPMMMMYYYPDQSREIKQRACTVYEKYEQHKELQQNTQMPISQYGHAYVRDLQELKT